MSNKRHLLILPVLAHWTHTEKHGSTHKRTQTQNWPSSASSSLFSVLNVQFYKRFVYRTSPTQQGMKRTSVQWTAIGWTAGQQETRWGVTTCVCMHPHMQVFRGQCSALLVKLKSKGLIWQRDNVMDEEDTRIPCHHETLMKGNCKSKPKNCDSELIQMNNAHHQLQDWSCSTSPMSRLSQ